jgi:hypothetical protein
MAKRNSANKHKEKARRALPFTPGFLKMAAEKIANDQT